MSSFITLSGHEERKNMPHPVSKSEKRKRIREAREIARQGHDDVMRRMISLKNRTVKVSGHFEGYAAEKSPATLEAFRFTAKGVRYVIESESEWQARLVVERKFGIKARDTVEPYKRPKKRTNG